MSKKNRKKTKRKSSSKNKKHILRSKPKEKSKQSSNKTWKWLARAAVVIAIIGAAIYFYPEVELYPAVAINPYDPFETPFVVENIGNISILDLNIEEEHIIKAARGNNAQMSFTPIELQTTKLSSNERTAFMPGHTVRFELPLLNSMEIKFKVSFTAFLVPYTFEKHFRYIATRNTKGEFQWYPKSMVEK